MLPWRLRVAIEQLGHDVAIGGVQDVEAEDLLVDLDSRPRQAQGLAVASGRRPCAG